MASSSEFEVQLEKNSQNNHLSMLQLGLLKPNGDLDDYDDGKGDGGGGGVNDDDDDEHDDDSLNNGYESSSGCSEVSSERPVIKHNVYGAIEGVAVGDWWLTSRECWQAGVHRPPATGAPLHCGPLGAYSVTLSDQCSADDVDGGERFTLSTGGIVHTGGEMFPPVVNGAVHTGDGNSPAAPQPLSYDTVTLVASMKSRKPVRVVRAHKLTSAYAPDIGYRYDGLYEVENYWVATSKEGATVYKFLMQRLGSLTGQAPPPWLVHKIVPPSLHRAVRVKYARALKSTPTSPSNAAKPGRQDTLTTTSKSSDVINKSRRKASLVPRKWAPEGGHPDNQLLQQQPPKKQCFDQLLQQKKQCNSYDQLLQQKKQCNSFDQLLQQPTTSGSALRMQASPSRANQQQKTSPKKRNIRRLFENYPFEMMKQQQQQELVLVRNQQLTPEPDPSDMFFDDDLSYLSLKKKSYQESVALGQAVSGSFEAEFLKICDELCSELPTLDDSSESQHAAEDNDSYSKLLELSSAACSEVQKRTHGRMLQDSASCSNSYNRLPQGGASCSKTLQNEVGSGNTMQNGVSYSRMSQEVASCSNSYGRLPQGGASCSKTMQSGVSYSRMSQEGAGCSYSYDGIPQGSASSRKTLQNGVSYGRIPQGSAGCSKTNGVSYSRMSRGGASCSKTIGVSYSRLSQGGASSNRNGGKLLQRGNVSCSRMSSQNSENYSVRVPQRSSRMYSGKIVAQDGENFSEVTRNSESTTQCDAANKRIKMTLDNSGGGGGSSDKEPVKKFVSTNRRKMPRRSSVVMAGQKKTSNFDHQAPPPVSYKSANDFLNALVGCAGLIGDKEAAAAKTDETEEKEVEKSVAKEEEKKEEEEEKKKEEEEEVVIKDAFLGFTAQDLYASKEASTRFADFLFALGEHTDENQWTGWGIVHRRSIIVNGFLIEQVQRESEELQREKEKENAIEEKVNSEDKEQGESERSEQLQRETEESGAEQTVQLSDTD